jgi:hypothetical protein
MRLGLVEPKPFRIDLGKDEILWRHRNSRQTPQHGELAGMCHRIGERSLKQAFRSHPLP